MENEKNKKVSAWLGRLCALFTAFVVCASFCSIAFVRPSVPVKAEDDIGGVTEYFAATFRNKMLAWGLTNIAGMPKSRAAAAVIGVQLGMLVVADNVLEYDAATIDMSEFKSETGWYIRDGNYYAFSTCWNTHNNGAEWYVGDASPIIAESTEGWNLRLAGDLDTVTSYSGNSSVVFQVRSDAASAGVECSSSGIFSDNSYIYNEPEPSTFYFHLRWQYGIPILSNSYSIHVYVPSTQSDGRNIFGCEDGFTVSHQYTSGSSNLVDYYNNTVLPIIEDLPIVEDYPELILFPDGIPAYVPPTEDTSDTTESGDDIQPFTLPPEWLETYTFPLETYPTIPFTDVEPPSVDVSKQNGISFWFVLAKKVFDSDSSGGLWDYFWIIFGLAVATVLIWKLGSHGGDKD